jgi:hypothetical protein
MAARAEHIDLDQRAPSAIETQRVGHWAMSADKPVWSNAAANVRYSTLCGLDSDLA